MRHQSETCFLCANFPDVDCNGCQQPICTVHRVATWPAPNGTDTVDYCAPCFVQITPPEPLLSEPPVTQ